MYSLINFCFFTEKCCLPEGGNGHTIKEQLQLSLTEGVLSIEFSLPLLGFGKTQRLEVEPLVVQEKSYSVFILSIQYCLERILLHQKTDEHV